MSKITYTTTSKSGKIHTKNTASTVYTHAVIRINSDENMHNGEVNHEWATFHKSHENAMKACYAPECFLDGGNEANGWKSTCTGRPMYKTKYILPLTQITK